MRALMLSGTWRPRTAVNAAMERRGAVYTRWPWWCRWTRITVWPLCHRRGGQRLRGSSRSFTSSAPPPMSSSATVDSPVHPIAVECDGHRPTPWEVHDWMSARRPKPDEGLAAKLAFHRENARMYEYAEAPHWVERENYHARQVMKRMGGGENGDAASQERH